MDASEYLAFLPLLFYGIALADLQVQWRRFFEPKHWYLPYFLATIMFTETAVWNVFGYLEIVGQMENISYYRYWLYLLQPMLYLIVVSALTPELNHPDTEQFFRQRIPVVFGLMAVYLASHFTYDITGMSSVELTRIISIVACIAIAISRRIELVYVLSVIWFASLFMR